MTENQPAASIKASLPFGSEFSPSQVELPELLEIAAGHEGNQKALEGAILEKYFAGHGSAGTDPSRRAKNRKTLAMNCRLGLRAYGIIDQEARLTVLGRELHNFRRDEKALYDALARHILLNLHGMALIQCIRDMTVADEEVNLTTLREGLAQRGVHYPRGGKHPSMMRLWLEKAGVFVGNRWQIDDSRLQEVLGTDPDAFGRLARFTSEQRAFLRALANTGMTELQSASEIARLATATYGVKFPEKSLPKLVLNALVEAGYITAIKTTEGRGAKPFLVAPTPKMSIDLIEPFFDQLKEQTDAKLLDLMRKPLSDILSELKSEDRYISGLALEAVAFKLMRLLDMDYMATRLRASATGGAEVDLVFQSARLVYSRWQVQCKKTSRVSLDDVAKEVGLAHLLKGNVILIAGADEVGQGALAYVASIRGKLPLVVCFLNTDDLRAISESPACIVDRLLSQAPHSCCRKDALFI